MKYLTYVILVFLAVSCGKSNENAVTYFGGLIINPKSSFVLFLKEEKVMDTLWLDKNNRFLKKIPVLDEGFYTFKHGTEFQYIYLEPSDSVLVRLNTWDFDKSLVFSGRGSVKNEFLINLFLHNEKEERMMYHYFDLNEKDFQAKIDSLSKARFAIYNDFFEYEGVVSKGFEKFTAIAIQFPLFRLKEFYPYYHNLEGFSEVSDTFYNFRKGINLNEENLVSFYPYQNYVVSYLYNISYQLKEKDSTKNDITVNILNAVNEHIKAEGFKNILLKRILVSDFLKSRSTCHINEEALSIFLGNCTNKEYLEQVNNLVKDFNYIPLNKPFRDFDIVSYNNVPLKIKEVINNKNAVIYFWSSDYMSSDYLVSRIRFLEQRHPDLLFIGINMNTSPQDLTTASNLKLPHINNQYILSTGSYAHNYLSSKYPRTIIIDDAGIVKNKFTNLDSKYLHSELNKLK
ncbi:TlpA family protein disulfide reductase [Lutibacter sp.]|uniref:TlpA family protein disulfide reductase n=1 Tax=Lutibacter sp. TaxID=1925666 RepID=UPI0035667A5B